MPEGDTIHKVAARLAPALEGATLVRFATARGAGAAPRPGTTITRVEAQGKYLIVRFADGHLLQTHLRMTGRWDLYRTGERRRRPAHLARAVIEVDGYVAVCSSAPVVRVIRVAPDERSHDHPGERPQPDPSEAPTNTWNWIDAASVAASANGAADAVAPPPGDGLALHRDQRFATLGHLGPDLCVVGADLDGAVRRMATFASPDDEIADVLLDQRIAAGIGNVYKSEVLWRCELHPLTPLGRVDDAMRRRLLETAAAQLQANLSTRRRTTVAGPPGSLAVYGRSRRGCRRCGAAIRSMRSGRDRRSTYWCPRCQPAPALAPPPPPPPG